MDRGVMPCSTLWATWVTRRRFISFSARSIEPVTRSAYRMALPLRWRSRAADGLDQATDRTAGSLLVGIQYGDEGDLRQIQSSRSRLIPNQNVELTEAETPDDLDALDRVDF